MKKKRGFNKSGFSIRAAASECLNIVKRVNKGVLSTVLAVAMLLTSFGIITKYYTLAYDVYYGDINIGVTTSKEEVIEAYNEAATDVEECNRSAFKHDLRFVMTVMPVSQISTTDIYHAIVAAAEGEENCFAIVVKNEVLAKVKTRSEAKAAINMFMASIGRDDAEIFVSYSILPQAGIVTEISSIAEAAQKIRESGKMIVSYYDILEENISVSYKRIEVEDESIPEGMTVCRQEGVPGVATKRIEYYENGLQKQVKGPLVNVIQEPVDEIVHIGTGKMKGLVKDTLSFPAEGNFTSDFGRRWGRNHNGIDIAAKTGTPVYAPAAGVVTFSGTRSGYGNYVTIDHGEGFVTTYAHMNSRSVSEGDVVNVGDLVGAIGTTGRVTGSHLHFEVLLNGKFVDPMLYIAD